MIRTRVRRWVWKWSPPFKTACQWSKAQLKIRADSLSPARLLGSSLSAPPLDFEDCPRLKIRKSVSTPKSKLRLGSTSKSKTRSETKPSCKINLELIQVFMDVFPRVSARVVPATGHPSTLHRTTMLLFFPAVIFCAPFVEVC